MRIALLLTVPWGPTLALAVHAASTIEFSPPRAITVAENTGQAVLTVLRSGDSDTVVTVDFATRDFTAKAGTDYTATSGTLTFAAGQTNQPIAIPILNDTLPEGQEPFLIRLSNPSANATLGATATAQVSITDDDPGIQVEFAQYWADEGSKTVTIGVTRGADEDFPATVDYATTVATAKAGTDYSAAGGTLNFAADEKLKLVVIAILNNGVREADETFDFVLSNPTGPTALGAVKSATVTIKDNDPGVHLDRGDYWIARDEGAVVVEVRRGNDGNVEPFTVDYATLNDTATAGEDYQEMRGTLAFTPGEPVKSLSIPVNLAGTTEGDESFGLVLSNPTPGVRLASPARAKITILRPIGTQPHHFGGIGILPDFSVHLRLAGGVHQRFESFLDLFPIEVSNNLTDWSPQQTVPWLLSSSNAPVAMEVGTRHGPHRFYRVPARHFLTPFAPPTGPYPVSRMDRWLNDHTRRNRFYVSTNSSFQVAVWYPAKPKAGSWPIPWGDLPVLRDINYIGRDLMDRLPFVVSYAASDLPLAETPAKLPVVVLSPGWTAVRHDLFEKADELASHGFVVIAPDHFDAHGVVLADGRYVAGGPYRELSASGLRDRVKDCVFITDQLEQWNLHDSFFRGRLNLDEVGVVGFSWGGVTAFEFCRVDGRCRAAVGLDPGGYFTPELPEFGLQKPSLTINRSDVRDTTAFGKTEKDAIWFQISDTQHQDIGGWDFWPSGTPQSLVSGREVNRTVNAYMIWFLNKYLRGFDEPMPSLSDHPRVINFMRK